MMAEGNTIRERKAILFFFSVVFFHLELRAVSMLLMVTQTLI